MKKAISLILALVLCLSMCACSIGDFVTINIPGFGDSANSDAAPVDSSNKTSKENHFLFPFLYGTWNLKDENGFRDIPYTSLTVNEDGTCVVDGKPATWAVSQWGSEKDIAIDIFIDGEHVCGALLSYSYSYSLYFYAMTADGALNGSAWEKESGFAVDGNDIVLTVDNWRDYFELRTGEEFMDDAFGDLELIHLYQYMVLKEEYADKVIIADVVVEMSVTGQKTAITVDPDARSYTLGEVIETVELNPEISNLDSKLSIPVFGNNYINIKDNLDPDSLNSKTVIWIPSLECIEMLRIKGTIYLKND